MEALELGILNWIQANCRTEALDGVMRFASALCDHGEIWIVLALVLLVRKRTRPVGAAVAVALVLDLLCCNVILKPLVARVRPCDVNPLVTLLVARPADWSFPSGHTAASMAAVGALRASGSRLWIPALALAALIAFSRLYLYVHWPSDVLFGAVLGAVLGILSVKIVKVCEKRRNYDNFREL